MTAGRGGYNIRAFVEVWIRRRGREVEGTPLLREHAGKTCIEGSNPSVSASNLIKPLNLKGLFFSNVLDQLSPGRS